MPIECQECQFTKKTIALIWIPIQNQFYKMPSKKINKDISKNYLINFYLDNSDQRRAKNRKFRILFYLMIFNYIIIIFKYVVSLFIGFNNETNLLLFDLSILLGGIPKFNKIFVICIFVFGLTFRLKFYLVNDQGVDIINQTFDLMEEHQKVHDYKDIEIIDKLNKFAKIIYKLFYTSLMTLGESSLCVKYWKN